MKSRFKLFSACVVVSAFFSFNQQAMAQKNLDEDDDLLSKKEKTVKDYTSKIIHQQGLIQAENNNAIVIQNGNNNSSVEQIHVGGILPNVVYVTQNGDGNESSIRQEGNGNTSLVNQDGSNNRYSGNVVGNNNTTVVEQRGEGNVFEHEIRKNDFVEYKTQYKQAGSNNNLYIEDNGRNSAPPQIIQQGHDMNLRIEVR